jgi:hypothetical protein
MKLYWGYIVDGDMRDSEEERGKRMRSRALRAAKSCAAKRRLRGYENLWASAGRATVADQWDPSLN